MGISGSGGADDRAQSRQARPAGYGGGAAGARRAAPGPAASDQLVDEPRGHQVAGVIHLATRQVTTWPYLMGRTTFGSVSLTADGSVLGFAGGTRLKAWHRSVSGRG